MKSKRRMTVKHQCKMFWRISHLCGKESKVMIFHQLYFYILLRDEGLNLPRSDGCSCNNAPPFLFYGKIPSVLKVSLTGQWFSYAGHDGVKYSLPELRFTLHSLLMPEWCNGVKVGWTLDQEGRFKPKGCHHYTCLVLGKTFKILQVSMPLSTLGWNVLLLSQDEHYVSVKQFPLVLLILIITAFNYAISFPLSAMTPYSFKKEKKSRKRLKCWLFIPD